MKIKYSFLSVALLFFVTLSVAQEKNHDQFLKKSSKFNLKDYKTYPELSVDGNFELIDSSSSPYLKSSANDQTIRINGNNIGRVVVYSRLFKNIDSISNNGELRIKAFQKGIKNPILTITKSFVYDVNQEFHYNFTLPNIHRVELNYTNNNKNYWVIEKMKFSELNNSGIKVFNELEAVLQKRRNLELNWQVLKEFDEKRVKNAITYIRKQDDFVKFIQNKVVTDDLEKTHNSLYNPTNNTAFDKELRNVFKNASTGNVEDFKTSYDFLKKGNWNDILLNVDEVVTGGKFQALISLIGNLFGNGRFKNNEDEMVYTKVKNKYYTAEFKAGKTMKFKPIDEDSSNSNGISLSSIKKRQDTITALQEYVVTLRKFEYEDQKRRESYLLQINLAKSELSKLKSAWIELVTIIDSNKEFENLEKQDINLYVDNDVLGPLSNCNSFDEYERMLVAVADFNDKVKQSSSRMLELASKVKNFNDTYYKDVYRDIENQKGRISIVQSIKHLPKSISNQFDNNALQLQNNYQDKIEKDFQLFTKVAYSER